MLSFAGYGMLGGVDAVPSEVAYRSSVYEPGAEKIALCSRFVLTLPGQPDLIQTLKPLNVEPVSLNGLAYDSNQIPADLVLLDTGNTDLAMVTEFKRQNTSLILQ